MWIRFNGELINTDNVCSFQKASPADFEHITDFQIWALNQVGSREHFDNEAERDAHFAELESKLIISQHSTETWLREIRDEISSLRTDILNQLSDVFS